MSSSTYTQADLTAKKVNELKTILQELGLATTGVKADLVTRILEHQQSSSSGTATEAATTTATDLPAAGNALGAIPSEDQLPSVTMDGIEGAATETAAATDGAEASEKDTAAAPAAPTIDLPALPSASSAQTEHEKRVARLARFGNTEELAKLQRAEKFGASVDGVDDKTISKLDSELSNKRTRSEGASTKKDGANGVGSAKKAAVAGKPASGRGAQQQPAAGAGKPKSANGNGSAKKREAPPLDPAEEEKRRRRAERFAGGGAAAQPEA